MRARAGHRSCSVKPAKSTRENFPKDSQRVRRRKDYVNKKFRRGPTHPRVAHSCLSTLGSNNNEIPFVGSSAWISLTDPSMSDMRTVTVIIIKLGYCASNKM